MSYVQGTVVRLRADFTDTDSVSGISPAEVICTVEDPSGNVTQHKLSTGEVRQDPLLANRYSYMLNTMPEAGTWMYQFESTGPTAVVGRKAVTVISRLVDTLAAA